ncbi:LOW QUALITY PROTEIN: uncharacterized protein LOC143290532 [Babylonia areolata]|uniref:LOW QUALITY PROTEIN: uncharacterized protein LOC143290532 n=1 Tax=Babylonia areolata TaxID=304850 RepID=UPI003FD3FBCA
MAHPIFCEVCNIGVSSEVTMRDHVKGRRHQQALGALERRKAMARNSLYCHGFPAAIPHSELRSYFQRFGPVTRIMVETQKACPQGCYCIVQYDTEAPVQKALNQRNHQLCGFTLTVRPRKPITPHRRPPDAERNQRKAKASKEEGQQADSLHEQLMGTLLQADSVLAQMEMLYESMRLSDIDLERRKNVCDYLHSVLQPFFPTCTIHQFGSSVNGFGMRGCDMDIFLDLHDTDVSLQREEILRHKLKPVNLPYIREIQALKTTEGPLMPSQLRQLSLVHRVKLMSRILMQHAHHCTEVLFVPSMRCPIVRFLHSPTGIKCDLSINNRLALRNTQLLKMCAEDRRVRLLVFAVRYWGRWKQVAGNQNCGPRLTNYCLSLLVLFYLANTSPPLLPSVQALADMTDAGQKCVIENWDCSLPEAMVPTSNTQSADELLHQFFQFYSQVSLSTSVISTRSGTVVPLNDFLLEKDNSPQLNDFKVKALAVQDPFVLHHNIAQNISNQIRDLLIQEIEYATAKTSKWPPSGSAPPPDPQTSQSADSQTSLPPQPLWGLPYLFSTQDCTPPTPDPSDLNTAASSWCEVVTQEKSTSLQWTFPVSLDLAALSSKALQALRAKGDYRAVWFRRVRTIFLWALREVFLFEVKAARDGGPCGSGGGGGGGGGWGGWEEWWWWWDGEERMCVEEEGEGGETVAGISTGSTETDSEGTSSRPSGAQEPAVLAETAPGARSPGSSDGRSHRVLGTKVDPPGFNSSSGAGGVEEGGMHSPHSEHSCSMPSPSEASPMSPHHAPEANGSPAEGACVQPHPATTQCCSHPPHSPPTDACEACSGLPPSSENNNHTQEHFMSGQALPSSECCDVEMMADSLAALPAPNHMGSSATVPGKGGRDLPNSCSVGEEASGSSVLPLRLEFNPVGDRKVYVSTEDDARSCSLEAVAQSGGVLNCDASRPEQTLPGTTLTPTAAANTNANTNARGSQPKGAKKCRPLRVYCEGRQKAWYGRKAMRTTLMAEGHADDLELEKLISKKIAERDAGSKSPPLRFYCTLCPVAKGERPEAQIAFEPAESLPKEFSVFPTFFKSYFTKLAAKNLFESATV